MRRFSFIFLLYGLVSGQVPNPCEDERFIKISEKFVDQMTDEEYKYFIKKEEECTKYENNNDIPKSLDNNLEIRISNQVPNPCEDERFIKISEKFVDQMTENEYQYFIRKEKECADYDKNNPNEKSLENNPLKIEKINFLENLSFIYGHSKLLGIVFLIVIISII